MVVFMSKVEEIEDNPTEVKVKPQQKSFSYKTQLLFIDSQRGKKDIVSVEPPTVTQFGCLQFLLEDRIVLYPIPGVIFSWSTEQLVAIDPPKIII